MTTVKVAALVISVLAQSALADPYCRGPQSGICHKNGGVRDWDKKVLIQGRFETCRFLQDTVNDIDIGLGSSVGERLQCAATSDFARQVGCCMTDDPDSSPGRDLHGECNVCGVRGLNPNNQKQMVSSHRCSSWEFMGKKKMFSETRCREVQQDIAEICCNAEVVLNSDWVPATPSEKEDEGACENRPDWKDLYGRSCSFYENPDNWGYCEYFGSRNRGSYGLTPNEACCHCKTRFESKTQPRQLPQEQLLFIEELEAEAERTNTAASITSGSSTVNAYGASVVGALLMVVGPLVA